MFRIFGSKRYSHSIDAVYDNAVQGWVIDEEIPEQPVYFQLVLDDVVVFQATTDVLRQDLNLQRGITGAHGFLAKIPLAYLDGQTHVVRLVVPRKGKSIVLEELKTELAFPGYVHAVDAFGDQAVRGWIYDSKSPNKQLAMKLVMDGEVVDEFVTAVLRLDVNESKDLSGEHGFDRLLPLTAYDGVVHELELLVSGEKDFLVERVVLQESLEDLRFHIDDFELYNVRGWAFLASKTDISLIATLYLNDNELVSESTMIHRPGLNMEFDIDGDHGFEFNVPVEYLHPTVNSFSVCVHAGNKEYCIGKKVFYCNTNSITELISGQGTTTAALKKTISNLEDALTKERSGKGEIEKTIAELQKENDAFFEKLAPLEGKYITLKRQYRNLQKEYEDLQSEMVATDSIIETSDKTLAKIQALLKEIA